MAKTLNVHLLPSLVTPEQLAGRTAVVIDVLRATTTIVHALAAGARAVVPGLHVEDITAIKDGRTDVLLGGERGGLRIDGFDLGNSPAEYSAARVAGKTIAFTTTNGTRAMQQCRGARRILLAAFVNLSAVCRQLTHAREIEIVCAGTRGEITGEDAILAGAITEELCQQDKTFQCNDQAKLIQIVWRQIVGAESTEAALATTLRECRGGENLQRIGLQKDIESAAMIDRFDIVPELDVRTWRIECAGAENASRAERPHNGNAS